ncbi:MAG: DUF3313 family protein [Proteobacteria bacterium]|nr:DUF3313 family protein [Pseudomonadota bacterium]
MFSICPNIRRTGAIALAVTSLLFIGCTTVTTQSFRINKNSNVESSQIAVGADFGKYDRLTAEGMGIFFPEDAAPSKEDQQRTRQIFRTAFLDELQGYRIVESKGPTTLEIRPTLIDYRKSSGGDAQYVRRDLRDIANPGSLVFLMELVDSESGEVLARAADSASVPTFNIGDSTITDWDAVQSAAERWAKLFRNFLDENLNK